MTYGTAMALSPMYIRADETAMANLINTRDKTQIAPTTRHGFFGLVRRIRDVLMDTPMYRIAPKGKTEASYKWLTGVDELSAAPSVLMPQ